ncbi:MAG: DNA translocase FtsK [Actinomycetota bacterium]|nr:DNA translocase FtsK [Actinomycetota bacterium]
MATSRKSPAKSRKAPAKRVRARRSPLASRPRLPRPDFEPHQVDVIGLGLIAIGIFLSCVTYLRWAGGTIGDGGVHALRFVFGLLGYGVPAVVVLAGALVVLRELRPPGRPLRTGALCFLGAASLALAAGTLGVGPGAAPAKLFWHPATFEARGGVVGESALWVTSNLVSTVGADILAVFMFITGLMLVTRATVAGVLRATGTGVAGTSRIASDAGRALKRSTEEITAVTAARRERRPAGAAPATGVPLPLDPVPEPLLGPELDTEELVVRATHVEAPAVSADGRSQIGVHADSLAGELPEVEASEADEEHAEVEVHPPDSFPEPPDPSQLTPQGRYRASVTDDPDFHWRVPSSRSLTRATGEAAKPDTAGQEQVAAQLVETLGHFGVDAKVVGRVAGPHITRYELRLAPGIKVGKVAQLKDDIAYALAATDIRILAPIPGKQAVGVEVPNARRRIVHLGDVFQAPPEDWSPLTVWLGKDVGGRAIGADLAKMPHLLVAGTTGAGKSGCVNAMLSSILLRATPHEVRLVLVDPKQVELNHYESIPHLLTPVITSPRMAANALQNLVKEMEQRYGTMSLARTRSLPELNRVRDKRGEPPLPYILCVIDELADLMMVAPADVEDSIIRLAQKARAVGIHLVLATQSPRVDVITGMIKANVPSRIAFAVSSQTDSRVILDQNGAESLLGQGDMLFSPVGTSRVQRIQGAYIDEDQIATIAEAWRKQGEPEFHEELLDEVVGEDEAEADEDVLHPNEDPLLEEAISLVAQMGTASTSMLQRRLRLGYTRAGRLIDMLERRSIISGYEGSKPRQVLITEADVPRILVNLAEATAGPPRLPAPSGDEDAVAEPDSGAPVLD